MELTCKQCGSKFRAALELPLTRAVRVACPSCGSQMVLKPPPAGAAPGASPADPVVTARPAAAPAAAEQKRIAAVADEPRPFRQFLGEHLRRLGFTVEYFETGDPTLEFARKTRAEAVILTVARK